jgi:hypothetical protein
MEKFSEILIKPKDKFHKYSMKEDGAVNKVANRNQVGAGTNSII